MKREPKSPDSNLKTSALVAAILFCVGFASTVEVFAQRRLNRPPTRRELEGTPILGAGTSVIPDGVVLIIEMDSRLDSGSAQPSDRFLARIATPVIDGNGRTLLPAGALIEGHVTSVQKAKWRHRSGELGLSFDYIEFGDGRRLLLRGTLVGANNRIDDEGNLKAKSSTRRDIIITSGAAAAGVGVGSVVGGGMLAGGGIGAAAGLTVALLIKGKDVVINPGDRFNLQLVQPMYLNSGSYNQSRSSNSRIRTPIPLQPPSGLGPSSPRFSGSRLSSGGLTASDPNSVRTLPGLVSVHDVRAERDRDGYLRVYVTAETPTNGWRIYTHHDSPSRDTLDIRLRGVPPTGYGARQTSRPTAPPIIVEDRNNVIRRIVVRGSNGERNLTIGSGSGSARTDNYQSSTQTSRPSLQPVRPRPGAAGPSDGSLGNFDFGSPTTSTGNSARPSAALASLATQTAKQIEVLRINYAGYIGQWYDTSNGTFNSLGGRNATASEKQLLDTLTYMLNSANALSAPSLSAYNRQQSRQQLQADLQTAQQSWQRVKSTGVITPELDRQWQRLQNDIRALISEAGR